MPLILDTFTASDGTAINGRTPDVTVSSRTWQARNWYFSGSTGTVNIQSNKASINTTDSGFGIDCGQDDYKVTWYCTTPASGQFRGGCRFRVQTPLASWADNNSVNYYFFACRFDLTTATMRFSKVVNNAETIFTGTNTNMTFASNTTYKFTLLVKGTTYTVFVDDVQKVQLTDTTFSTGTFVGFGAGAISGNNFTINDVSVDLSVSTGTVSKTLSNVTSSSDTDVIVSAILSKTLASLGLSSSGTVAGSTSTGTLNKTFGNMTSSSQGGVVVSGALSKTLAVLQSQSISQVFISGVVSKILANMSSQSGASVLVKGFLDKTFDSTHLTSLTKVLISGSLNSTFQDATQNGNGNILITAVVNYNLASLILASDGDVIVKGVLAGVLENAQLLSSGNVYFPVIVGTLDKTLQSIELQSNTSVVVKAILNKILEEMTSDSLGSLLILGNLNKSFSDAVLVSEGSVRNQILAELNQTLENLGYSIRGVVYTAPTYNTIAFVTQKLEGKTNLVITKNDNAVIKTKQENENNI